MRKYCQCQLCKNQHKTVYSHFFTLELKKEALPRFSSQFYDENFEKKLKLMRKSAIDVLGSMRI